MTSTGTVVEADRRFTQLWAKTNRDDPSPDDYHALALHLVDVAAVAYQLWLTATSPYRRQQWGVDLGADEDMAGRWLAFLAGCHDLGKASVTFQRLDPIQMRRVVGASRGTISDYPPATKIPHGQVTAAELRAILQRRFGMSRGAARRMAVIAGGHHGRFPSAIHVRDGSIEHDPKSVGQGAWESWRESLIDYLAKAIGLPQTLPESLRIRTLKYPAAIRLGGFISLSDWIGSDEDFFPLTTMVPLDAVEAFVNSTAQAQRALQHHGWLAPSVAIPSGTITDTFPWLTEPFGGQLAAMRLFDKIDGPGIAVVEYPMGWGKTEIALWAAARWAERDGIDGFYVAMPTRTTSDQLFSRASDLFGLHHGPDAVRPNLRRISGLTPLSTSQKSDRTEPAGDPSLGDTVAWDMVPASWKTRETASDFERLRRSTWFEQRNRGLLARYGVGTVDQAMLGVLKARHHFVRLEGLAGKTVIFDEVHSYDVFMATIVDELIRWLGTLGSPVVILTATLPWNRTLELIEAYRRGAGWPERQIEHQPYPRLTIRDERDLCSQHIDVADEDRRTVALRRLTSPLGDDLVMWQDVATRLGERLANGGTAAVVCNTVSQSQDAYRALCTVFPKDELTLFHARFRRRERRGIQEKVLSTFGRSAHDDHSGSPDRICPRRHVVVATQVIEQSLDLDFDLMVSMFCPTDLLLQRSGRLHRHKRTRCKRPRSVAAPELWVTGFTDGPNGAGPYFHRGSEAVYGRYPLLRSWWALRDHDQIVVPNDIEPLIEATYAPDHDAPTDPVLLEDWEQSRSAFEKRSVADEIEGRKSLIPELDHDDPDADRDVFRAAQAMATSAEDLPPDVRQAGIHTRLGPPSIDVVILTHDEPESLRISATATTIRRPTDATIEELVERIVGISLRGAVRILSELKTPPSWDRIPTLRHARSIILDEHASRSLADGYTIGLHPQLGITLERDSDRPTTNPVSWGIPPAQDDEEE